MTRVFLRNIQNYGKNLQTPIILTSNFRHRSSNKNDEGNDEGGANKTSTTSIPLGQTTIFVQQGCDIQELPVILRKLKKDDFATLLVNRFDDEEPLNPEKFNEHHLENGVNSQQTTETKTEEIISSLDNCMTSSLLLSVINQLSEKDLSPEIAAHAFDRLIRNESLIGLRNFEDNSAVFAKLIDCITKNGDHKMLLDFMEVLKTFLDLQNTVQRFCDELLLRNSDGILNIIEICECIERFVDCKQAAAAEKFWIGISDNEKYIDDKNIKFIYKILPKLKISRRLVIGVIERQIPHVWWNLSADAVTESITALAVCNCSPFRTMQSFARWLNTNIHAVNENNLEVIIRSFTKLEFSNSQIEKALERYIKAKGVRIKAQSLISAILEHCVKFRLRNNQILNSSSEYFIANHSQIDPATIKSILITFGNFSYQPLNSILFWQIVENYLKENFSKIQPHHLIEMLLNCCYLEMYPLNFVSSIFNPYFLDLLHSRTPPEMLLKIRNDLQFVDTALSLECDNYSGPLLPRDHSAKSIWQDGRIKRIANNISDYTEKIAGGPGNFTKNVIVGKLPTNSLYMIDILIHPPGIGYYSSYSIRNDRNVFVAVLIHLPEYYNSTGEHLIGPQVMRIRHMRKLGLKVVTLNYNKLAKLTIHPEAMNSYLVEQIKQALPALPK